MSVDSIYNKLRDMGYDDIDARSHARELFIQYEVPQPGSVEHILKSFPGPLDFIGFNGQNCEDSRYDGDDECAGWDGISHRCNCGNRRVSWVIEGTWAYGDAY